MYLLGGKRRNLIWFKYDGSLFFTHINYKMYFPDKGGSIFQTETQGPTFFPSRDSLFFNTQPEEGKLIVSHFCKASRLRPGNGAT